MPFIRNQASQTIGAQMVSATTGDAFVGTVTVYVTGDAGTQAIGAVGSGLCTHEGQGYYTYVPSATETNYALIAFTFTAAGAVPATVQVAPLTAVQAAAVQTATAAGAITVASIITRAFARINVIQAGETPSAEDMAEGFLILNAWMDSLALDRLTIPFIQRTTWTLTSSAGTLTTPYTVGTGGTIDIARPVDIDHVNYQDTNVSPALERGLDLLTDDAWAALPQKNQTGTYPVYAYYRPTYASNFGSLYLWPTPSASSLEGVLYSPSPISRFNATADTILLPPGYLRFIRDNLAVEFAATWRENLPVDPGLLASARMSRRQIQQKNLRLSDLSVDRGLTWPGHLYDITVGDG